MHYYTHNIGDFSLQTRFLNPEEIGVYVLLRDQYIATEAPLQSSWIALAMHPQCKSSVERVLALFFTETESGWSCSAFENLIKEYKEESDKKRVNALKRWEKAKNEPETDAPAMQNDAGAMQIDAGAMQLHSFAMLTNNHKPITNNHKPLTTNQETNKEKNKKENVDADASLDSLSDDLLSLSAVKEEKPKTKKVAAKSTRLELEALPYDWFVDAIDLQPELDGYKLFDNFCDYWLNQEGKKGMKLDWRRTWRNYLRDLPEWKKPNYIRHGYPEFEGKRWYRPVDPNSSLGQYQQMQAAAEEEKSREDDLIEAAERFSSGMGIVKHDPV